MAKAPDIIISTGIGSCVVVTLYDRQLKIGGLAHIMMPENKSKEYGDNHLVLAENLVVVPIFFAQFADEAIDALLERLLTQGAFMRNIEAKIAGGARLFPSYNGASKGIGDHNVISIKCILKCRRISLTGWDVGGRHGRSVEFHLGSGRLFVSAIGKQSKEI